MKIAIVGSKCEEAYCMGRFIPEDVTEIVAYGTKGVSPVAKEYALLHNIKFTEFIPQQKKLLKKVDYDKINSFVDYFDEVIEFGDKRSRDVEYIMNRSHKCFKHIIFVVKVVSIR